jgi:hypothetical protein
VIPLFLPTRVWINRQNVDFLLAGTLDVLDCEPAEDMVAAGVHDSFGRFHRHHFVALLRATSSHCGKGPPSTGTGLPRSADLELVLFCVIWFCLQRVYK